MACYLVGDLQGCLDELQQLLEQVEFNPTCDSLWLTGDLIARGPKSLDTLRFVKALGECATVVLGNHDLHLLAIDCGFARPHPKDNLQPLLTATDRDELLTWLRHCPLLAEHPQHGFVMVHAGLPPQWTLATAHACAQEVEAELRGPNYRQLLKNMYGNQPDQWQDTLTGIDRLRYSINALTRMRCCTQDGRLDLLHKLAPDPASSLNPWFKLRPANDPPIIFGHWAALAGQCDQPNLHALDTGCVWGNRMTLLRWDDQQLFSLPCPAYAT